MPDIKITELPSSAAVATGVVPVSTSAITNKVTLRSIADLVTDASQLTAGTLSDDRLSNNIARTASLSTLLSSKADLDNSGKVPAFQLPSYVDDVIESANLAALPSTGETGKIYVTLDNNKTYRWSGSTYVEISASPGSTDSVPEGSVNKYYTDVRASAAAPVQSVAGKIGTVSLDKGDVGLGNVDNTSDANKPISTAMQAALNNKASTSHTHDDRYYTETEVDSLLSGKQASGDYATLVNGTVPANQLPSYVDDAIEVANSAALPTTGETGKIYVTLDSNKIHRWSGSTYVEISASPGSTDSVPEGSINKYYTDARARAAAPVQSVNGQVGTVSLGKSDVGLGNVDNTSDANKPVSTAQQAALDLKSNVGHTHTAAEINSWLSQPGSRNIYVDNGRTDSYTEDGSQYRPYKTMRAALASLSSASSLTDFNDVTKRFYCFRIAPGFYDEEAGGTLNIPVRPVVVFDLTGGVTLKGNYLWSRPADLLTNNSTLSSTVVAATTNGSNTITVSTSATNYSRLKVGTVLTGTGMPLNTVITAISGSTITLNNNATATNASVSLSFDAGELGNFVFAMIGSNHRPMYNNGAHSMVGILGNLTINTVDSLGFNQVHLTNCGVRGVIEATGVSSTMQLYAYQDATFDTLKAVGAPSITLYATDCENSSGGNGFGNIIGKVGIQTMENIFFHAWASVFPTGSQTMFNLDGTLLPAYNEIKATSFTRVNNVATVTLSLNHGQSRNILPDGYWREQYILINGVTEDTSFNTATFGAKVVDFPTANTVSYENTGPDVTTAVTAASAKWIKGTFFGNASAGGYIQPGPVGLSLNEAAIHTHPGWNTNTQPGVGTAYLTARSSAVTFRYPAVGWSASAQYVRNRILLPGNGYQYRNVTTTGVGRSGTTQPTWPTTIGGTVVDGAITWQCEQLSFPLSFNLGFAASTTSGSNQVTVANGAVLAANFQVGYTITGTGIPSNTTITAISGSTLTLSANATATNASVVLTVAGTAPISYNVQQALELLHDSKNIYHNQIDSGIGGAATVQQAFKSLKTLVDGKATVVSVPASATATGTAGQIAYDSSYLYICTAANTWRRVAIASW